MKIINGNEKDYEILQQQIQRESMITKLLNDIRVDIVVCDLMNTNKMEYIKILKDEIDNLYNEKIYNKFKEKNIGRFKDLLDKEVK